MVNDNSLSDSVLIQIGALEKDIKDLEDILSHLEHSGESGRGYDRQVANIKNQIQQKTKQIQQFKRSINMNDAMDQLAIIGITQDADPSQEIRNDYIQEIYRLEKEMARLYRMGQGAQAAKIDQQLKKLRKELRELNTKDDDATEHGSIETYGKEKETETMPLEKNPVQAQDAKYEVKYYTGNLPNSELIVETVEAKSSEEAKTKLKHPVSRLVQVTQLTQDGVGGLFGYEQNVGRKRLKEMLEDLKRKKATLERAISSQEHYYTNPKTKQDEQELAGIEMQIQTVQHMLSKATHDEEPNHVQDSYEMLKLCGIVS